MKHIYVIHEENEIITSRNTMNNAIAAVMNRFAICGYLCEEFNYDEVTTTIKYRDLDAHETRTVIIEEINYMEGV